VAVKGAALKARPEIVWVAAKTYVVPVAYTAFDVVLGEGAV
jgi:hypothetical protein